MFTQAYTDAIASHNHLVAAELIRLRRQGILFQAFTVAQDAFGLAVEIEINPDEGVARAYAAGAGRVRATIAFNPDAFVFQGCPENLLYIRGLIVAFHEIGHFVSPYPKSQRCELFCDRLSGAGARLLGYNARAGLELLLGLQGYAEHPPGPTRAAAFVKGWVTAPATLNAIHQWKHRQARFDAAKKFLIGAALGGVLWRALSSSKSAS